MIMWLSVAVITKDIFLRLLSTASTLRLCIIVIYGFYGGVELAR